MTNEDRFKLRQQLDNQVFVVGELCGLLMHLRPEILKQWLDSKQVPDDFRYQKQVRAAIRFAEEVYE